MGRGRKPQSAEQAARKGDAGKRARSRAAAEAAAGAADLPPAVAPSPHNDGSPEWLELTPAARRVWSALMPLLSTMSFVKATDHGVLARYCTHLARWIELNGKINARGEVHYETNSLHGKMLRQHPDFAALMRIEAALVIIEDRVGLTPAARQSLVIKAANAPGDTPPGSVPHPGHPTPPSTPDDPDPTSLFAKLRDAQPSGPVN
jgi:P27 family predicted phage terminase small subunit